MNDQEQPTPEFQSVDEAKAAVREVPGEPIEETRWKAMIAYFKQKDAQILRLYHRGPRYSDEYGEQLRAFGLPTNIQDAAAQLGISPATLWKRIQRNHYKITQDILKPARKWQRKMQSSLCPDSGEVQPAVG